ncbi:MAG: type VI secretion system tip protein VgrG [Blastocatellia bacterium]|nr:type VI secretion system tip protein VgrG [Blastocatellia bacterium]
MADWHWPFYLKIDGQILKDAMISNLEIRQELGAHYWCDVEFRLINQQQPPVATYLGKTLEFIAFEEYATEFPVFNGLVLEAELAYELHGDYIARLRGVTESYKLQLTPEEDYFYKKNLKEVAQQIISQDGLELQFNANGDSKRMNYVQWGESDFDFLRRIADDQGCFMRPTPKGVEIRQGFEDTGLTIRWNEEHGLISFSIKGWLGQPSFDGTCYDPRTMESKRFNKVSKEPQFFPESAADMVGAVMEQSKQLPPGRLVFDGRSPKIDNYQALLEKESQRSLGSKIIATGISRSVRLMPGEKVRIEGTNFAAQGDYGLTYVVHHYDQTNGYRNEFIASPWMDYTAAEQPKPNLMFGVVSARVVNHNDPRGMGRIQIKYDWMEDEMTSWARMTMPSAGGGRGIMFMPEIGDEVLVAFEYGDPERPYIIGALWNSVDSAPRQGFWDTEGMQAVGSNGMQVAADMARNDIKRIVTKSGNRIQLVDVGGKESIVISTPGGQTIQLIDSCPETGGRKMLCLNSPGDIFLNAPDGRVHIRSKFFSRETG